MKNTVSAVARNGELKRVSGESATGMTEWVAEIKRLWGQRRSNTMELAQAVYTAKRKLLYGQWTHLLKSRRIPFAKRTAEMLVVIAKRLGKLDAHSYARLPSALNTLYLLAQLDPAVLVSLTADGTIHPAFTINEAKELLARYKPQRNGSGGRPRVKQRVSKFREFVLTTLPTWNAGERTLVQSKLLELLEQINASTKFRIPNRHRSLTPQEITL